MSGEGTIEHELGLSSILLQTLIALSHIKYEYPTSQSSFNDLTSQQQADVISSPRGYIFCVFLSFSMVIYKIFNPNANFYPTFPSS